MILHCPTCGLTFKAGKRKFSTSGRHNRLFVASVETLGHGQHVVIDAVVTSAAAWTTTIAGVCGAGATSG